MARQLYALTLLVAFAAACGSDAAITTPEEPAAPGPVLAIGTDPVSGATIETNLDDYMPGEVVHVTGRGWTADETVRLFMTEDPNTHEDVTMDVVADSAGGFSVHFYDVQNHDIGVTFTLTATGQTSGSVAVATFTDQIPVTGLTLNSLPAVTVGPAETMTAVVVGAVNGGGSNKTLGSLAILAYVDGASPSTAVQLACFDVDPDIVHISGGAINYTRTFSADAPAAAGVYDVLASAYADNTCTTALQSFTLENAITVVLAANQPPVVDAGGPYSGAEGSAIALSGATGSDPDVGDVLTYAWTVNTTGIDAGGSCSFSPDNTVLNPSVTCTDDSQGGAGGKFTLTLEVNDGNGHVVTKNADLTVTNADPTAGAGGPYTGSNEGSAVSLTGTKSDAGTNDTHTYAWTWAVQSGVDAGASCSFSDATALSPTVTCTDDGVFTLTLTVTDDDGAAGTADATLTLGNANPSATLNSPTDGALFSLLNGAIAVSTSYSDAGSNDTHECRLELDGAMDVIGSYAAVSGGTCAGSITPLEAGVYTLMVRVKDDDGGEGTASIMVVVYDPSAGFVTGGGWIQSEPGAYRPNADLGGKATFGFVSKYKKGATTPEGNTEFQFHAGGMNFHSSQYQWLVVNQAGTNAQFKGTGTINGLGSYTFMLWATDTPTGDKFRLQITDNNDNGATVYDNGTEQLIASGSIVIHTGGKK